MLYRNYLKFSKIVNDFVGSRNMIASGIFFVTVFSVTIIFFYSSDPFLQTKVVLAQNTSVSNATSTNDITSGIQAKIDERASQVKQLEQEISQYESEINSLSNQADSLSSTVKSLDLTQKKISAQINLTEDKISAATASINDLSSKISDTNKVVLADTRSIRSTFAAINSSPNFSIPVLILSSHSISDILDSTDKLGILTNLLIEDISHLNKAKDTLNTSKTAKEQAEADLVELRSRLKDQKSAVASAVSEKNDLLSNTKQSQVAYQKILDQKKALKDAFEQEMQSYEESLHLTVNKGEIPPAGRGVLSYPLDDIHITQYFGNTAFSTANPQIYNGKGHTGVDFRASIGTPVKAALTGQVVGMGNTDLYKGCYSYGKWIMVKHPNGLSTLYAHLSVQDVKIGDLVSAGSVIGLSGNTGYSTGPHLHFGVYATAGVSITKFTTSKNCKGATIPLADFSAYLNPLSYL